MMGSESQQQQGIPSEWWIVSWRSQLATGLSLLQIIFGIITSISIGSFIACVPTGLSLVFGGIVILSIEAPSFVSFIRFAQPIGQFFESKPLAIKFVAYAGLAILPCLFGCYGPFFFFGFFCALGTTAIFGLILIGQKANQDDMRFQAGAFSPA